MVAEEWHDNGPQDLVTVSLCIQIAIDKMQLCSLSLAYACTYHNPTATMGHSVHHVDISKPLANTTPYILNSVTTPNCSQVKTHLCTKFERNKLFVKMLGIFYFSL